MKTSKHSSQRLNYSLSDGLLITTVKIRKGAPLAICYATDLNERIKLIVDLEGQRIISGQVQIKEADIKALVAHIKKVKEGSKEGDNLLLDKVVLRWFVDYGEE